MIFSARKRHLGNETMSRHGRTVRGVTVIRSAAAWLLTIVLSSSALLLAVAPGASAAPAEPKVTLCHAKPPATAKNGYNKITISANAVIKEGHDGHAKDIIPPFTYTNAAGQAATYPGKNFDAAGQAILANGCKVRATPPPPRPGGQGSTTGARRIPVGGVDTGGGPLPESPSLAVPVGIAAFAMAMCAGSTVVIFRRRRLHGK